MIRYGMLGFGHHSAKRLVPGFAGATESVLAGLWRRNGTKATENAREFGIPHAFENAEGLCASSEIDAVFVTSPDALHLPHVLLAAKHGKHVLCEKPLGMNVGEVEAMLTAARKAGVMLGVAQNMRYNRCLQRMREWIAEGRIGAPVLVHAQFCYEGDRSPRAWIYDPALACGGPIGDVGIHCVDALRFVMGDVPVTTVNTLARKDAASGDVESSASMALGFASGAMGSVTVTTRAAYRSLVEVAGETGVLICENAMTVEHPVDLVLRSKGRVVAQETISNEDGYSLMVDSFSAAIEGRGQFLATGEDGLHNQRVLDASYRSWHTGARQTVPLPAVIR